MAKHDVERAAKLLNVSVLTVRFLIRRKEVDWGICTKASTSKRYFYLILWEKFYERTGLRVFGSE